MRKKKENRNTKDEKVSASTPENKTIEGVKPLFSQLNAYLASFI